MVCAGKAWKIMPGKQADARRARPESRTGQSMKVIAGLITPLTPPGENPSKREAPAGWRRGYAADCKAARFSFESNPQGTEICADKARTIPEHDKRPSSALGAEIEEGAAEFWSWFDGNLRRQLSAGRLVCSIMELPPNDRIPFLEIMLDALRPGWPQSHLIDLMDEARWWVASSTLAERKAYCLSCYEGLSDADQRSFVAHVTGRRDG